MSWQGGALFLIAVPFIYKMCFFLFKFEKRTLCKDKGERPSEKGERGNENLRERGERKRKSCVKVYVENERGTEKDLEREREL